MAHPAIARTESTLRDRTLSSSSVYQAYRILQVAFVIAPIVAGSDKFFHLLVNWDMYLAPSIARLSPIDGHSLMLAFGVIEIARVFLSR